MEKNTFFGLLDRYLDGQASPSEERLLEEYYRRLEAGSITELTAEEEQLVKEKLYQSLSQVLSEGEGFKRSVVRKIFPWRRIAVAASIILTIGIGSYFIFFNRSSTINPDPISSNQPKDLLPGRDAAMLTLSDGRKILLDSATGTIIDANGILVINVKGLLTYQGDAADGELVYNTITTARGNQYQLQLEDGTKVWLNSASSLRYPVAFKGNDRQVELTGEGYFEVAHNPSKPFKVATDKQIVEVLGTHFNINSYDDEEAVRTTLLEGSVEVKNQKSKVRILSGQQAVLAAEFISINSKPDLEKVMAWKNGWFEFDQMDLAAIMRQVSRWYDVDIVYESKLPGEKFGGRLSKHVPLSVVMEMMKANGVECKLNRKTLVVRPASP